MTPTASWLNKVTRLLLMIGTWTSFSLVLLGGLGIIYQFGGEIIDPKAIPHIQFALINWQHLTEDVSLLPHMMIQAGLLLLVIVQVLRVAILFFYYIQQKDKWFIPISGFILVTLLYSFFWQYT